MDSNGALLIHIVDNELVFKTDLWDVEFSGKCLTIRKGPRDIIFECQFNTPSNITLRRATFYADRMIGVEITSGYLMTLPLENKFVQNRDFYQGMNVKVGLCISCQDKKCTHNAMFSLRI